MAQWSMSWTRNSSPLAGFVLSSRESKYPAMLVNSQLVASCQLGFKIVIITLYLNYLFLIN